MAVLFMDSADHYTDPAHKWSSNNSFTVSAGNGRNSTACLRTPTNGATLQKNLTAAIATGVIGFAFKRTDLTLDSAILQIREGSAVHVSINSLTNGALAVVGPGGTLGTSAPALIVGNVYAYIEVRATIHDSTGAVTVRINGVAVLTLTNVDTQNAGTATFDNIRFTKFVTGGGNFDWDDIYICDTAGGVNDDFLGDVRVQYRAPTGAGNSTDWTPLAGSNFQNVDDAAPDEDTTYNSATLAGAIDLYETADLTGSPTTVFAVQAINRVREDDAGSHTVAAKLRAGTTTDTGATVSVNASYDTKTEVWDENPDTAAAWAPADFPIEVGVELIS
jgi:hypothetical protein